MQVDVRLSIILRRGRFTEKTLDLPEESNMANLLETLGIATSEVAIMTVNGKHVLANHTLRQGDQVCMYPPTAGG